MEEGPSDEVAAPLFSAFVSYSHADAAVVRKLHGQLESYRLPKGLGTVSTLNASGGRLGRVFRDREDLSAAESLSEAVTAALDRSEVLVVVCSPDARRSKWVGQEIAYFREHRPGKPILAALVRGEPAEAFPDALTAGGAEPLAADLRKEGDGWKLGFLKIVAGIAGVPLDALVQRDSQRQTRRVMAVTGMVAVLALIMAGMTVFALQARNEAQTLRRSSDAFIDELLTDGRKDLVGVGRLDVLDKFNERALRYYASQGDLSRLPADSLQNWARILHAMGEDETKKTDADLDKALEMFRAAYSATGELVVRDPANADRVFAHAQSAYWVGWVDELEKDYSSARKGYAEYRDLAQQLAKLEPTNSRSKMELGFGELNIGIMDFKEGNFPSAGKQFDRSISYFQEALALDPTSRSIREELANAHAWRYDTHYNLGEYRQALLRQQDAARLKREIAEANPDDFEARFALLVADRSLAMVECQLGNWTAATARLAALRPEAGRLLAIDPRNAEWTQLSEDIDRSIATVKSQENCRAVSDR